MKSAISHIWDFAAYKLTSTGNIGPFGQSQHAELKFLGPLILNVCSGMENCLLFHSPIEYTKTYWENEVLKINHYKTLTPII